MFSRVLRYHVLGVRRRDLPGTKSLRDRKPSLKTLKIVVGADEGLVIGQIVADKGIEIPGIRIEQTERGRVVDEAKANGLDKLIFQDLPKGNYELQIVLS
jgi:hypothetical protein